MGTPTTDTDVTSGNDVDHDSECGVCGRPDKDPDALGDNGCDGDCA